MTIDISTLKWGAWNLFLALMPFFISWFVFKNYQKKIQDHSFKEITLFILLFSFWLLLFPNIPYLFLDYRHIMTVCEPSSLNRCFNNPGVLLLLFSFVSVAIPIFVISSEQMRIVFEKLFNKIISYIFLIILFFLSSIGLHLGLIERFNSWNIINHPSWIFKIIWEIFITDIKLITVLEFSISLSFIFFFFKLSFMRFRKFIKQN